MIFIDTWAWVALALKGDQHHRRVKGQHKRLQKSRRLYVTTNFVLSELIAHLYTTSTAEKAQGFINSLLTFPTISPRAQRPPICCKRLRIRIPGRAGRRDGNWDHARRPNSPRCPLHSRPPRNRNEVGVIPYPEMIGLLIHNHMRIQDIFNFQIRWRRIRNWKINIQLLSLLHHYRTALCESAVVAGLMVSSTDRQHQAPCHEGW